MSISTQIFAKNHMRADLKERVQAVLSASDGVLVGDDLRGVLQPVINQWLANQHNQLRLHFFEHFQGTRTMRWLSDSVDVLIRTVVNDVLPVMHPDAGKPRFAMIATGGYGRRELFAHSDVDILLIAPEELTDKQAPMLESLLYFLWDAGLKIGHRVVSPAQAMEDAWRDLHFRTSLLDARRVAGSKRIGDTFIDDFNAALKEQSVLQFVEDKLAERDERHERAGSSRFILQPHMKDGKGGLRDLHTLYWLARMAYGITRTAQLVDAGVMTKEEYKDFARAAKFLSTVRMALHWLAGKAEERLTFDHQREIAQALGYRGTPNQAVERFMKRYFQVATSIGHLTRSFCAVLEDSKKRKPPTLLTRVKAQTDALDGFVLEGERLSFATEEEAQADPARMIEIYQVAQATRRHLHPRATQAISRHAKSFDDAVRKSPRAVEAFWRMMLTPQAEFYLRKMNEVGLLARMIPPFRRLAGQMQFDMYHTYTVDEHILVAVGMLHRIAAGEFVHALPQTSMVMLGFKQSKPLFLAMLCHDIGKGRGGNHPKLGAEIGRKLARDLGLNEEDQALVAWLVEHHQLLTDVAFKRDVQDPSIWQQVADKVDSLKKLRMLLVITAADIHAVGPQAWNQWKGSVLRQLYRGVERVLSHGEVTRHDEDESATPVMDEATQARIDARVPEHFWETVPPTQRETMVGVLSQTAPSDTACLWHDEPDGEVTILSVVTPDKPALFAQISGVLSACQANIVTCRVRTLKDGVAVDTFWLQDSEGQPFNQPDRQEKLETLLHQALADEAMLAKEVERVERTYYRPVSAMDMSTNVYFDQMASLDATVLEVNAADRIGLLYSIASTLAEQRVSIHAAHIMTYGPRAVDVFYIKDQYGHKIEHPARLEQIEGALKEAVKVSAIAPRKAS